MVDQDLYDISVAEVRGEATPDECARLSSNVFAWRDALQAVVDNVDSQRDENEQEFRYALKEAMEADDQSSLQGIQDSHNLWKSRVSVFRKHVNARLLAVKRMCQEQVAEDPTKGGGNLELAMKVVACAMELMGLPHDCDVDEWQDGLDQLEIAVLGYEESVSRPGV